MARGARQPLSHPEQLPTNEKSPVNNTLAGLCRVLPLSNRPTRARSPARGRRHGKNPAHEMRAGQGCQSRRMRGPPQVSRSGPGMVARGQWWGFWGRFTLLANSPCLRGHAWIQAEGWQGCRRHTLRSTT
jgi:hypothetical protein